jgi:hypothetical protein
MSLPLREWVVPPIIIPAAMVLVILLIAII